MSNMPEPKSVEYCEWFYDDLDDYYHTPCGTAFVFNEGGCKENNAKFCHHCGKPIKETKVKKKDYRGRYHGMLKNGV